MGLNTVGRLSAGVAAVVGLLGLGAAREPTQAQAVKQAPIFEVDPFWPEPLPHHWVSGSTIGLAVDAQDNVWTIHRPNTVEDNFKAADIMVGDARGRDDEAQPGAGAAQGPTTSTPIGKWSPQDSVETLSFVSRFELIGAHAGQIAVTPRGIVERINVVRDVGDRHRTSPVYLLLDPFLL